jgi:phosphopantothenoylcysteine decarboxylase/phosphopantothenate--cysteine ligase
MSLTALVTSGPTHEPIDPVRYIGNRSSGKQGHAIALALAKRGVAVTLISGPVALSNPSGVKVVRVNTAEEMLHASLACLPVDIAVCAAAVADWRVSRVYENKLKKSDQLPPILSLAETQDILKTIGHHAMLRPKLVIGFAAETDHVKDYAKAKRISKGADWILANKVSATEGFEADTNTISFITEKAQEDWEHLPKTEIAERLADKILAHMIPIQPR